MAVLPIIKFPDPRLKQISKPVEKVDRHIQKFMDNLLDTMYDDRGVGLAAVQVGELKRILVMDVDYKIEGCNGDHGHHHDHDHIIGKNPLFLVNPEIIFSSKETTTYNEGCLSFPELHAEISRPSKVKVKYLDYNGDEKIMEAEGLLSTCVQHEIDHLNGITFIDHLSKLKRDIAIKKFKKFNHLN